MNVGRWVRSVLWSAVAFLTAYALGGLAAAAVTSLSSPAVASFDTATAIHLWTGRLAALIGLVAAVAVFWWVHRAEPTDGPPPAS